MNDQEEKAEQAWVAMSTKDKVADWVSRHEYTVILGGWVASIGVAGAIITRDKYVGHGFWS